MLLPVIDLNKSYIIHIHIYIAVANYSPIPPVPSSSSQQSDPTGQQGQHNTNNPNKSHLSDMDVNRSGSWLRSFEPSPQKVQRGQRERESCHAESKEKEKKKVERNIHVYISGDLHVNKHNHVLNLASLSQGCPSSSSSSFGLTKFDCIPLSASAVSPLSSQATSHPSHLSRLSSPSLALSPQLKLRTMNGMKERERTQLSQLDQCVRPEREGSLGGPSFFPVQLSQPPQSSHIPISAALSSSSMYSSGHPSNLAADSHSCLISSPVAPCHDYPLSLRYHEGVHNIDNDGTSQSTVVSREHVSRSHDGIEIQKLEYDPSGSTTVGSLSSRIAGNMYAPAPALSVNHVSTPSLAQSPLRKCEHSSVIQIEEVHDQEQARGYQSEQGDMEIDSSPDDMSREHERSFSSSSTMSCDYTQPSDSTGANDDSHTSHDHVNNIDLSQPSEYVHAHESETDDVVD